MENEKEKVIILSHESHHDGDNINTLSVVENNIDKVGYEIKKALCQKVDFMIQNGKIQPGRSFFIQGEFSYIFMKNTNSW